VWENLIYAVAYLAVGIGMLLLSAAVVDLLTPGRLLTHVVERRSHSSALVLAAALIGQGLVIFTAIWTNATAGFGDAMGWTIAFGLLGVVLNGVAFFIVDLLTPGKLGTVLSETGPIQPIAVVTAASHLAVAGIVVASIA
jgi:uncharacterized membrane protein YjfL (UPF0719 family)